MDLNLTGKRALVTGSNSGIGAGMARMLAQEGASVIVHGRNEARAKAVHDEIVAAGGKAACVLGDLQSDEQAAAVAEGAVAAFGGVDILVNNAGGRSQSAAKGGFFQLTAQDWADTYNMNVLAAVRMCLALAPAMKERGWGRIINVSSFAGQSPTGNVPDYAAAKSGMSSVTLSLSKTLKSTGVTVNTISPGLVRTALLEDLLLAAAERNGLGRDVEKGARWVLENSLRQTVDRLGTPEDIAFAVCQIASPRSDFLTGANIRIDGGASSALN